MSDEEMAFLRAKVASLEDTILAAFEELQIVKFQQRVLVQARRTQSSDDPHPAPVTIHSVPVEILSQIFAFAVHGGTGADRVSSSQDAQHAFRCSVTIAHVCRFWREVSLQTSSLWAYIVFGKNLRGVKTCLGRSKTQPLTIIRAPPAKRYPTLPEKNVVMKSHLETTSSRWMNLHWISSDVTMRHILSELNRVPLFPFLNILDLIVDERRLSGYRLAPFIPDFTEASSSRFPNLEHLKLTQVPPSDLPPVEVPSLRTLYLHFPHKQQTDQREVSHLLRISSLCALLYRTPNLEELIIDDSSILMDVRLRPFNEPGHGPPVDPGARQTHHIISPLSMTNLIRFQWDFAPARDLWRLFYFVRMPSLRHLDLVLDRSDERWVQVRGGLVSTIGNIQPISELLTHPVVRFEQLEDLRVECLDTDGLSTAFRKLEFPNLKSLSLTFVELNVPNFHKYNRTSSGPEISSQLPRAESIFRDPRMPNLTSLELINFHLDGPHTRGALQYMPALERLALDSCTNAGEIVRALNSVPLSLSSGGPGRNAADAELRHEEEWLCPALEHIVLRKCHDVGVLLSLVAYERKLSSMIGPEVGARKRAFIPLRMRKRAKHHKVDAAASFPTGTHRSDPGKRPVGALPPPGGWGSHQRKKPRMLKTVYVEMCDGFTEAQIEKMRVDVEEVVYVSFDGKICSICLLVIYPC